MITKAIGSETITVAGTAIGFTAGLINPLDNGAPRVVEASFVVETAPIRITLDGSTPTATVGMLLQVGDAVTITGNADTTNFRAIRTTATSASINVTFFR